MSRLCLFFEAADARFAIAATSVTEVAAADAERDTLRGHLSVGDLSKLLGGKDEARPGTVVVIDSNPTVALRTRKVLGAFEAAHAPFFQIPRRLKAHVEPWGRGVLERDGTPYFELDPEGLTRTQGPGPLLEWLEALPPAAGQCLCFESGGKNFAVPLNRVVQVVGADHRLLRLPAHGALRGALVHARQVWPVYSVPALLAADGPDEPLVVLADLEGEGVGLLAQKALGVKDLKTSDGFSLIDVGRMFS